MREQAEVGATLPDSSTAPEGEPFESLGKFGRISQLAPAALLMVALAVAMAPLARPWTIAGHSLQLELVRLQALHAAVAAGDLWPTWLPDLYGRHGSPLPLFYSPLTYLLPMTLMRWGVTAAGALELATACAWLAGTAGSAWAARAWFGRGAGVPAAAAFALAPYLLVDLYTRTAFAELHAMALLPWAIGALARKTAPALAGGAVAVGALVLAHNITALMSIPILLVVAFAAPRARRGHALSVVVAGVGLAAFFWIPALAMRPLVWAEESLTRELFDYRRHLVAPWRALPFGAVYSMMVEQGRFVPVKLGELLWLGLLAAPVVVARASRARRWEIGALTFGGLAAMAMITSPTRPVWAALPLLSFVQFPFRWLAPATVLAALGVGAAVTLLSARRYLLRLLVTAAVVVAALVGAQPFLDVHYAFLDRSTRQMMVVSARAAAAAARQPRLETPDAVLDLEFVRGSRLAGTALDDFLPRTVTMASSALPLSTAELAEAVTPGITIEKSGWVGSTLFAELRVEQSGALALHQFCFPGWRVEVDGRERASGCEPERGRIVVDLEPGDRLVRARFGSTPLRRAAGATSGVAALVLALLVVRARRQELRAGS